MGQGKSCDPVSLGPFAASRHADSCHMRDVINKRDFLVFLRELKKAVSKRESVAFVADGMTFTEEGDEPDVLAYKVSVGGQLYHHVYLKCTCPRKYAGMNINQLDSRGQGALHVALRKRDSSMVQLLLSLGSNPNQHSKLGLAPLHIACETGDREALGILLQAGVNPNTEENQSVPNLEQHFRTGLTISASNGDLVCLSKLLDAGADVNVTDSLGNSALHKAALFGHTDCVKTLLLHEADPNIQNTSGATPLNFALLQMHTQIVRMLIKAGSDVTMTSRELPSNLVLASLTGETEIVNRCVRFLGDVDTKDRTSMTALYYTFTGDIGRLRKHFPDINSHVINFDFQYCQLNGRADTLAFLLKEGSDVETMMRNALSANILTAKHFTLPHNVEMFTLCLRACGFSTIPIKDIDALFWKLLGRNSQILIKLLLSALPRLDGFIKPKLLDVVDWTGMHTSEAVIRYLENAGAETPLARWIQNRLEQPRSLQEWCRQGIRAGISRNVMHSVTFLPLPKPTMDYVLLKDVTDYEMHNCPVSESAPVLV